MDIVKEEIEKNTGLGFAWIREFVDLLDLYEKNRETFPDLHAFMPEMIKFFEVFQLKMAVIDAGKPHVVAMVPANGAQEVDPELKELRVTFSIPMEEGFSWCGGGDNYPDTPEKSHPFWLDDHKTCVLPVKLKPGIAYHLFLNTEKFQSFRSQDGVPLKPVIYRFSTKKQP